MIVKNVDLFIEIKRDALSAMKLLRHPFFD